MSPRYFKSTLSYIVWKFTAEGAWTRVQGETRKQWLPSIMDVAGMGVLTKEITAEEGEAR